MSLFRPFSFFLSGDNQFSVLKTLYLNIQMVSVSRLDLGWNTMWMTYQNNKQTNKKVLFVSHTLRSFHTIDCKSTGLWGGTIWAQHLLLEIHWAPGSDDSIARLSLVRARIESARPTAVLKYSDPSHWVSVVQHLFHRWDKTFYE